MSGPVFVLVPGAGGAESYWQLVRDRLTARGVESVAVSLPGADPEAGLPEYVDIVVDVARAYDRVVLVAQSIGGFTASWAADRVEPEELVLVNAMIPVPGEAASQWWEATGSAAAMATNDVRQGRDPAHGLDDAVHFYHDVPPEVLALDPDDQEETEAIFVAPWGLEAWPDVPTRVIAGRDDRLFPLEFQRRVARQRLGLDVEVVPGGHLVALSRPDELTEALLRGHRPA
ncbi:MAG: alpha/beta hydrolase [Aeromicrobium sp.]|jgi:pimeloyl-ACP methyl ester carboxylesterase|uniref:alpha/beta fold hydrolase n=1 Tax=Aeromicrobium sp. TaxID=1871063 RepID=UPI00261FD87C|nr:alpha/beta hydrolase [Aeromicrobium sp.]MCW2824871.1 alpha/beta hydrolase [Aeromicrobium sp.]